MKLKLQAGYFKKDKVEFTQRTALKVKMKHKGYFIFREDSRGRNLQIFERFHVKEYDSGWKFEVEDP